MHSEQGREEGEHMDGLMSSRTDPSGTGCCSPDTQILFLLNSVRWYFPAPLEMRCCPVMEQKSQVSLLIASARSYSIFSPCCIDGRNPSQAGAQMPGSCRTDKQMPSDSLCWTSGVSGKHTFCWYKSLRFWRRLLLQQNLTHFD